MLVSFELTMPSAGSWNGKWTGASKKYFIVQNISKKYIDKAQHFEALRNKGTDSWHHDFGDGWSAKVTARAVDAAQAKQHRKESSGFMGYDWMVRSIISNGEIKYSKHS